MATTRWKVHNPSGSRRVVVTKELPGSRWLEVLERADARVEYGTETKILPEREILAVIGDRCHGAIGQLTERWGEKLFSALKAANCRVYSNYAVGYNNVDVDAATRKRIPVGNTPGVLTQATAEMAVALTLSAARRIAEGDVYMRGGLYQGWLPTLMLGELLSRRTVGVIGAGRIGSAYARMMVEAFRMNCLYFDRSENVELEQYLREYSSFLAARGEAPVTIERTTTMEELLERSDVVSLHPLLDESTHHLVDGDSLSRMKSNAVLVNTSRGPVIDESALVDHCRRNPDFRAGLDVFEDEPLMKPGLSELKNVVLVPHLASATTWTRQGMATLAASNVAAILEGWPVSNDPELITDFVEGRGPEAAPSIVNADELGLPTLE